MINSNICAVLMLRRKAFNAQALRNKVMCNYYIGQQRMLYLI